MDFSKNHGLRMALGCLVPILLLLALPYFGIRGDWTLLLLVGAMVVCHLMMGGHGEHQHETEGDKEAGSGRPAKGGKEEDAHGQHGQAKGGSACH